MDANLEAILQESDELPTLPAVAVRLISLARSEDIDMKRISDELAQDPALAAKVIGMANSSLFSPPKPVTTVARAVATLGLNALVTVALSFSLVRRKTSHKGFDHDWLWKRALFSAVAARCLAARMQLDKDELFLSGLFQDIGMLAFGCAVEGYGDVFLRSEGVHPRLEKLEREVFGAGHPEVGAWLAKRMGLPPVIQQAVSASHTPAGPGVSKAMACVAVSGWIADIWLSAEPKEVTLAAAETAQAHLGLDGVSFAEVLSAVAAAIPKYSTLFDLEVGGTTAAILQQAREELVRVSLRLTQTAQRSEEAAAALAMEKRDIEHRMSRDRLTGLWTRAHIDEALPQAFAHAQQSKQPFSVLFCDIDHFKRINDTYGHAAGDRVLAAVAKLLIEAVRPQDIPGRYGGEEFVVGLPNTDKEVAATVAQRARKSIEGAHVGLGDGQHIRITVSIGVAAHASALPATSLDALVQAADAQLYRAKREGRNRVIC